MLWGRQVGYSARSADDHRSLRLEPLIASMPVESLTPRVVDRALELPSVLVEGRQHRAPAVPDLLIAATGELAELVVLHIDEVCELVADVAGQAIERLAGS